MTTFLVADIKISPIEVSWTQTETWASTGEYTYVSTMPPLDFNYSVYVKENDTNYSITYYMPEHIGFEPVTPATAWSRQMFFNDVGYATSTSETASIHWDHTGYFPKPTVTYRLVDTAPGKTGFFNPGKILSTTNSSTFTNNTGTEKSTSAGDHYFTSYSLFLGEINLSSIFTASADKVNFNRLETGQIAALKDATVPIAARYDALGGNDKVTLPDSDTKVPGGWSEKNWFYGSEGNDTITGGDRNDKIDGGPDTDTIVFQGAKLNSPKTFNRSKLAVNKDIDSTVVVKTTLGGTDRIKDAEIAEFAGVKHPLAKFYFEINRDTDGTAKLTVYENGTKYTSLKIKYDTLTPIPEGEYAAYFRTNNLKRIELEDWREDAKAAVIKQSLNPDNQSAEEIDRTFIQIHQGSANGQSEGCFLVGHKSKFIDPFYEHVANNIGGGFESLFSAKSGGNYYYPVVPITVNVSGAAPQPKVVLGPNMLAQDRVDNIVKVKFDVGNPHPIKGKFVDVFFTVDGDAGFGVGWTFVDLQSSKPTELKHNWLWHEGNNIYGVRVGVEKGVMKSDATVRVKIFGDKAGSKPEAAEFIKFKIVDFALHTKSASNGWKEYSVSKNDIDTDGQANGAEKLLFGGASTRKMVIKIEADPVVAMGEAGSDMLVGEPGSDMLVGGPGSDKLVGGPGDDILAGRGGDDVLRGGGGNDVLRGGAGDDILTGGRGNNTLFGGDGADRFVFTPGDGADRIMDFEDGVDSLDLTAFNFSSVREAKSFASNIGGSVTFDFSGGEQLIVEDITKAELTSADILI